MKISQIDVVSVSIPLKKPFTTAAMKITHRDQVLVRIHTDNGLIGIGEASAAPRWPRGLTPHSIASIIECVYIPMLLGKNPLDRTALLADLSKAVEGISSPLTAIDIALHDLAGKYGKQPLFSLLGGLYRKHFPLYVPLGMDSPENIVRQVEDAKNGGFSIFKIKVGGPRFDDELATIRTLRDTFGHEIRLRVDANQGWDVKGAISKISAMEEYAIDVVEQPVPWWNIKGLAEVRRQVRTPIMADESILSPIDALKVIENEAADLVGIKIAPLGGLEKARSVTDLCRSAGISCCLGSMLDLQIIVAAGIHLLLSQPSLDQPTGILYPFTSVSIVKNPVRIQAGEFHISSDFLNAEGLGIEIDEDVVEAHKGSIVSYK